MPINRKLQNLMTGLNTKQVSNGGTSGSIPILYKIAVDGGATESVSVTVDRNLEVVDVWCHLLADGGANGNSLQVLNGTDAITDAFVTGTAGDKDVVRCGEIDDAYYKITAGGTLKVTSTSSDDTAPAVHVFVLGYSNP